MAECVWPNGSTVPPNFSWQGHFGWRDADLSFASKYHRGLDTYGYDTVHAIADGEVVHVGRRSGWAGGGVMVWIQHDGFFTRSLHLAEGSVRVHVGQRVSAGQPIARMGNTNGGAAGMAVHLHLEVTPGRWHGGNFGQVDPRKFIQDRLAGGVPAGIDQGSAPEDEEEWLVAAADDIAFIKNQVGGSSKRESSLRQDVDALAVAVERLAAVLGGTIERAEKGESISQRLDTVIKQTR